MIELALYRPLDEREFIDAEKAMNKYAAWKKGKLERIEQYITKIRFLSGALIYSGLETSWVKNRLRKNREELRGLVAALSSDKKIPRTPQGQDICHHCEIYSVALLKKHEDYDIGKCQICNLEPVINENPTYNEFFI